MAEHTVVVVGSNAAFPEYTPGIFWVIDFSDPAIPTAVSVGCPWTGVVLDCAGSLAAVADCAGDKVTIYDISKPASPRATGSAPLFFDSIGAISFCGEYVLVGEASNNRGARVGLIDINNLVNPQIFRTTFARITDVRLLGATAVICGLGGHSNAFQAANISKFSSLAAMALTDVSAWAEYSIPFMCDFDGMNAVFSDGGTLYLYGIAGGGAKLITLGYSGEETKSVAIVERGGTGGAPAGGLLLAYTADCGCNVELQYAAPPIPPAMNWISGSASLSDPINIYGQPITFHGGTAKFYRTMYGTSAILATAAVTETVTGGTAECVVSLFDVEAGDGSITATRRGVRAPVPLPNTISPNNTLGVTVFTLPW